MKTSGKGPPTRERHEYEKSNVRQTKTFRDGFFERMPYASLMAALLCIVGVVLFSIMMKWGFSALFEQIQRLLKVDKWNWLDKVQIFFVVIAIVMSVFIFFFATAGFFATGDTRNQMFRDSRSRSGGRCACALIVVLCFVLLSFWLLALSITSAIVFAYHVFDSLCSTTHSYTESDCLDLSLFQPLISGFSHASLRICGGDAQQFCALTTTAYCWFWVGWAGAILVIGGLCQFIAAHAANYSNIRNAWKYVELHECLSEALPPPIPSSKLPPPPTSYSMTPTSRDRYTYASSQDNRRKPRKNGDEKERYGSELSTSSTQMAAHHSESFSQYAYNRRPPRNH